MDTRLRQASIGALALALWILTHAIPSLAQPGGVVRTATVLPYLIAKPLEGVLPQGSPGDLAIAATTSPTKNVFLNFNLAGLPNGACVSGWTLRLYVLKPGQYFQNVRVFPIPQERVQTVHNLSLNPNPSLNNPDNLTPLLLVHPGMKSVSFAKVTPEDRFVDFDYSVDGAEAQCSWLKANGRLGVTLQSDTNAEYAYYGSAASCEPESGKPSPCNTQPRLIVRYYTSPAADDTSWPQNKYDPQNSGRTPWKTSAHPPIVDKPVELYHPGGYVGVPVIYEGGLIVPAQLSNTIGSEKFFIAKLDRSGQPLWNIPTNSLVKFPLAVDAQGRVYAVTENCFLVLNANDHGALLNASCLSSSCAATCQGRSLLNMNSEMSVRAAPTLGSNGAVYVPTNRGLFALTPYPELKVLWKFLDDKATVGRVALSADEATAYVEEGTAGKLIAIDTTDGSERWRGDAFTFKPAEASRQVPVVGPMNGEGENGQKEPVYVAAGEGGLKVFLDTRLTSIADEKIAKAAPQCERRAGARRDECLNQLGHAIEASLNECDKAGSQEETRKCKELNARRLQECTVLQTRVRKEFFSLPGAVSQPVIAGAGEASFVKKSPDSKGQLCRYAWTEKDPVKCASRPGDLSALSFLAADGTGNVYVIDPTSQPQRVLGFAPPRPGAQGGSPVPSPSTDGSASAWEPFLEISVEATRIAGQEKSTNFRADNFLIGPDGALYNANDNVLFAMQPKAQDEDVVLNSEKAGANRSAFLARQKITVESGFQIVPAQSLILESAGSIGFQPGVSVPKGARLTCIIQPTLK